MLRRAVRPRLILTLILFMFGFALLSGPFVIAPGPAKAQAEPSQLVIAVYRFDDRSGSSLVNVGAGVADELIERLVNAGYRVVERQELEGVLQERGLNPALTSDLAQAARLLNADVLIIGSVTRIDIQRSSISLGFLTVEGATVTVELAVRIVDVYTSQIVGAASVSATAEGETGFSLNLGQLLGLLASLRGSVCSGGFLTDKTTYVQGEIVNFGYLDPTPPHSSFRVLVKDAASNTIWISSWKGSTPAAPCVTWAWDQRDLWSNPVPPGTYTAELWLGVSTLIATRSFNIVVGTPPAWVSEITVGTQQFDSTIVGQALDSALEKLVGEIGRLLHQVEPQVLQERAQAQAQAQAGSPQEAGRLKGRVLEVWDDGTIVIDLGRDKGVQQYDIFEVYPAREIYDLNGNLIDVVPATEEPKGEIIVYRVEDHVSLANKIGSGFEVQVGDLVIRKEGD